MTLGVAVLSLVIGNAAALSGDLGVALLIWTAGAGTSIAIAFSAPWLITFFGTEGGSPH